MKTFEKPLSAQEEKELLINLREGDSAARNVLIEKNMRLVAHIVKKYTSTERDYINEDLISVGTIGLIKAVDSFDIERNVRFATYAAKCIDNELLMMLRNDRKKLMELSLSEPIGTDKEGNDITFMDVVGDEERDDAANMLTAQQLGCIKEHMGDILSSREMLIICERFGLFGKSEKTQNEIAGELGISRSYVSRIERKALDKLHTLLNNYGLLE